MFFFFLFSTPRYLGPIWDSTPHGALLEKKVRNIIFIKRTSSTHEIDQDPRTSDIFNPNKTCAKPNYNIKTKTNNTTLTINPILNVKNFYHSCNTTTTS
jgi:hypothetical protein